MARISSLGQVFNFKLDRFLIVHFLVDTRSFILLLKTWANICPVKGHLHFNFHSAFLPCVFALHFCIAFLHCSFALQFCIAFLQFISSPKLGSDLWLLCVSRVREIALWNLTCKWSFSWDSSMELYFWARLVLLISRINGSHVSMLQNLLSVSLPLQTNKLECLSL